MPKMDYDDFLAHYGVLGMKWGVRKRETPAQIQAKADKEKAKTVKRTANAQKYVLRAKAYDQRINTLRNTVPRNWISRNAQSKEIKELVQFRNEALVDAQRKREGKLSTGQKKVVVGASVVAALVAAKLIHNNVEAGNFNRLSQKGKAALDGKEFEFARNSDLARKLDLNSPLDMAALKDQVIKPINPDFGEIGTKMNCRRATFAYEMRRRGYDVKATKTTNGFGQNAAGLLNALSPRQREMNTSMPGVAANSVRETLRKEANGAAKTPLLEIASQFGAGGRHKLKDLSADGIYDILSRQPDGSRGEIGVQWKAGGGHSMVYEIINGRTVIIDGQSGKMFKSAEEFTKSGMSALAAAGFTRLDDQELNTNYLMKWLKNAQ